MMAELESKSHIFRAAISLMLVFVVFVVVSGGSIKSFGTKTQEVEASLTTSNLSGYAWSSNIGWIRFNCEDTTSNNCSPNDWGVNIDTAGNFSGYAWSSNIGWITFNASNIGSSCPSGGTCAPKLNSDNTVTGWIRACSVFQSGCTGSLKSSSELGGWDGWIALNGSWTNPSTGVNADPGGHHGVYLDSADSHLKGFAWGGVPVGWINFSPTVGGVNKGVLFDNADPTVAIDADNKTPDYNTSVKLTWTTTGSPTTCVPTAPTSPDFGWGTPATKNPAGGNQDTTNITAGSIAFAIKCTKNGHPDATGSVSINTRAFTITNTDIYCLTNCANFNNSLNRLILDSKVTTLGGDITITPINGYNGTVDLSMIFDSALSIPQEKISFYQGSTKVNSVSLSGGAVNLQFKIEVPLTAVNGNYQYHIRGISGTFSADSQIVNLTIGASTINIPGYKEQ